MILPTKKQLLELLSIDFHHCGSNSMPKITLFAEKLDAMGHHDLADKMDRFAQRQMMLPLEIGGDYEELAKNVIPQDEFDPEYIGDEGIYHVTPYYPDVLKHGLMSRDLLSRNNVFSRGLGGEISSGPYLMEDPETVATTYSRSRASMIEEDLKILGQWLQGEIPSSIMIYPIIEAAEDLFGYGDDAQTSAFYNGILSYMEQEGFDTSSINLENGDEAEQIGRAIDEADVTIEDKYDLIRNMSDIFATHFDEAYYGVDDVPPVPISGLTAPYDAIKDIRPENVATIPLKIRKNAPVQHFPAEEQLNFRPWDLELDTNDLLPHEQRLIQKTMMPVHPKGWK